MLMPMVVHGCFEYYISRHLLKKKEDFGPTDRLASRQAGNNNDDDNNICIEYVFFPFG